MIEKVTKLLVKLVKHNPDLSESSWQCRTASIVPVMMMIGSGSVFIIIIIIIIIINVIFYHYCFLPACSLIAVLCSLLNYIALQIF